MPIPFNDTTNLTGLVQLYEEEIDANVGDVSGNTNRLKKFTNRSNLARARYFDLAIQASGVWQLDSSNNTDYAIIEADLIAGQRDYAFTTDDNGLLVKDIYKVLVKDRNGIYYEVYPVDQQTDENMAGFWDGQDQQDQPTRYDKTGNAIFLDAIPNYSWRLANEGEKGIKVFVSREPDKYVYTDTTKTSGFPYHEEYFFLKPAYEQARIKGLECYTKLRDEVMKLEGNSLTGQKGLIQLAYANRSRDEQTVLRAETINSI